MSSINFKDVRSYHRCADVAGQSESPQNSPFFNAFWRTLLWIYKCCVMLLNQFTQYLQAVKKPHGIFPVLCYIFKPGFLRIVLIAQSLQSDWGYPRSPNLIGGIQVIRGIATIVCETIVKPGFEAIGRKSSVVLALAILWASLSMLVSGFKAGCDCTSIQLMSLYCSTENTRDLRMKRFCF